MTKKQIADKSVPAYQLHREEHCELNTQNQTFNRLSAVRRKPCSPT